MKALISNFEKIKTSKSKNIFFKHFKIEEVKKGSILTTPTSGSQDLFIIAKGSTIIFVPNRYNEDYSNNFIIIAVLDSKQCFNENGSLYDKGTIFGSLVMEKDTDILSIDKKNLKLLTDDQGNFQLIKKLK